MAQRGVRGERPVAESRRRPNFKHHKRPARGGALRAGAPTGAPNPCGRVHARAPYTGLWQRRFQARSIRYHHSSGR